MQNEWIDKFVADPTYSERIKPLIDNINWCTVLKTLPSFTGEYCLLRAVLPDGSKVITRSYPRKGAIHIFVADIGVGGQDIFEFDDMVLFGEYEKCQLGEHLVGLIDKDKLHELQLAVKKMQSSSMRKRLREKAKKYDREKALRDLNDVIGMAASADMTLEELKVALETAWNERIAARVLGS